MVAKIDYSTTSGRIWNRLQNTPGCVNVFALDQGVRTLRDDDIHLPSMMRVYENRYVGRYNLHAKREWIKDDITYMYKVAVR